MSYEYQNIYQLGRKITGLTQEKVVKVLKFTKDTYVIKYLL